MLRKGCFYEKRILVLSLALLCFLVGCKGKVQGGGTGSTTSSQASTTASTTVASETTTTGDPTESTKAANTTKRKTSPKTTGRAASKTEAPKTTKIATTTQKKEDKNSYTYGHISITLPDGFTVDTSDSDPIAVSSDYPNKTDNIGFGSSNEKDSVDNYSQETLDEYFRSIFAGFIKSTEFGKIRIDGHDALKYSYQMEMSGVYFQQTVYVIFGDSYCDTVTFTSVSGDFDEAFKKAAETIRVK